MGLELLKIIFQDKDLAVLDKPAGLLVHPTLGEKKETTLVDEITKIWPGILKFDWLDPTRAGIVHRLDKDTSGLIIIAKNPETLKYLQDQFRARATKKIYTLLCFGKTPEHGEIKTLTTRDEKLHSKQKISLMSFSWQKCQSREAVTKYKTIKYYIFNGQVLSLVEAQILTGRTHQIRNHFKYIGHPIVGDQMYFTKESKDVSDKLNLYRQFLHSSQISFKLPEGKIKTLNSDLPQDLKSIIEKLK